MSSKDERMQILEMVESGLISADEGTHLLRALQGSIEPTVPQPSTLPPLEAELPITEETSFAPAEPPPLWAEAAPESPAEETATDQVAPQPEAFEPDLDYWRRWWTIPMWIGVGITIAGGALMYWAFRATGLSFWFGCAWLPFLLGLAVMVLGWSSRSALWLHLRVHRKPDERPATIAISFPLPTRLTAWLIRTFGHRIPHLDKTGVDEMILALRENTSREQPLYIEVDEGENGERVQIYIG